MEYFIAKKVARQISEGKGEILKEKLLNPEIFDFVCDLLKGKDKKNLLDFILSTKGGTFEQFGYLGGNALTLLCHLDKCFGKDFSNCVLQYANLNYIDLTDTSFNGANLENTKFHDAILCNTSFNKANLKGSKFIGYYEISCLTFNETIDKLICSGTPGTIKIIDMKNWKIERIIENDHSWVTDISFSPDYKYFVSSDNIGNIFVWETKSFKKIYSIKETSDCIGNICFSRNGKYLLL